MVTAPPNPAPETRVQPKEKPVCPECQNTGKVQLLTSTQPCKMCNIATTVQALKVSKGWRMKFTTTHHFTEYPSGRVGFASPKWCCMLALTWRKVPGSDSVECAGCAGVVGSAFVVADGRHPDVVLGGLCKCNGQFKPPLSQFKISPNMPFYAKGWVAPLITRKYTGKMCKGL